MSFEPKSFIDISKELKAGNSEAHYRSLINRAYYGVFGHIIKNLPLNVSDASVHQELIKYLRRSPNVNEKKIASRLETLFKNRKDADYKYFIEIKSSSCDFVINEAELIISKFESREDEE
jgi:uncharacterized protein (UPF0332 family)